MSTQTVDWQMPDVQMMLRGSRVTLHDTLQNRRGIIFGVPGAFTPVCTQKHLPGFRDCLHVLKEAVHLVACVAVNDPYVLKAWAKELKCPPEIVMISDWEAKFTKALGLELDASSFHMGSRCRRFCLLVEDDVIVWFGLEEDAFVDKIGLILKHLGYINEDQLEEILSICARIDDQQTDIKQLGNSAEEDEDDEEPEVKEPPMDALKAARRQVHDVVEEDDLGSIDYDGKEDDNATISDSCTSSSSNTSDSESTESAGLEEQGAVSGECMQAAAGQEDAYSTGSLEDACSSVPASSLSGEEEDEDTK